MITYSLSPCGNLPSCGVPVERLHTGQPILAPTAQWWESGVTFNSAAVYLLRSAANDPIIADLLGAETLADPRLRDGVVAAHYRARPRHDPGFPLTRSYTGLALFTPDTAHLLRRYDTPVISPCGDPASDDCFGVEDPRITQLGDTYYALYCGVKRNIARRSGWGCGLCLAQSHDLRHWEKLGAVTGGLNEGNNKDGVLFPEMVDGQYLMLHRPMDGPMHTWGMHLAVSDAVTGPWRDCGAILYAEEHPACRSSWVGAGSVPIPLGDGRYLAIFHTGHLLRDGRRQYDLDAAILDLRHFDPYRPADLLAARLNRIMVPETECEVNGPFPDSVANVLFTCGSYQYGEYLYFLYGGGDTYVMSARIHLQTLVAAVEERTLALA